MISVFLSNRGTVKSNILRKTLSRLRDDEVTPSTFQNYVCPAAPVGDIPEGVPASAVTNCLPVQNMIFQSGVGCTDVNWCEPKEGTVGLHWPLLAISRNYNNTKSTFHQQEPQTQTLLPQTCQVSPGRIRLCPKVNVWVAIMRLAVINTE